MICRMWRGWCAPENADAYETYLREELFPTLAESLTPGGYRGFELLRLDRGDEIEIVTLVWFTTLDAVRRFAGDVYETPVISPKARALLSRWADHCDHYTLRAAEPPRPA